MSAVQTTKMSNFRWVICVLLFLATTVNYMDRQVLSLTWKDFIAVDFHWTDAHYGSTGWAPRKVTSSPSSCGQQVLFYMQAVAGQR